MAKTLTALAAACALCMAMLAATPARAMDPWTAALWLVSGIYIGSVYGMPYTYAGGAYRNGPYYPPPPYYYPPAYGYPASTAPVAPVTYEGRDPKSPDRCMPATMTVDGAQRQVRICY